MKPLFVVALGLSSLGMAQTILYDSFDDNSRNPLTWGSPYILTNVAHFIEQNQRTEFIAFGSSTNDYFPTWQDSLYRLTAELDWTLSVDIENAFTASGSEVVAIGASLFNYDFYYDAGLYLVSTNTELKLFERWWDTSIASIPYTEALANAGTIRFSYSYSNQTVEVSYANNNGSQYDRLLTIDTSEWEDIKSSGFIFSMSAAAMGTEVASGEIAFDNVLVDLGLEPSIASENLMNGDMLIHFTGNLEYADTLWEGWESLNTATNSPVIVPTTNSRMYFRTTMP